MSIRSKLITASTLLIVLVIGLFCLVNIVQSRRIIDHFSAELHRERSETIRQVGVAQLQMLADTARIALVQADYSALQTIVTRLGKDKLVTAAAVVGQTGTVLAHSDGKSVGASASGLLLEASQSGTRFTRSDLEAGGKSMAFAMPVAVEGQRLCTVFLAYTLAPLDLTMRTELRRREIAAVLRNTVFVGLLAVVLGVLLTVILASSLTRPIVALARTVDQVASGDLQARVSVQTRDEVGLLAERFNVLAEQTLVLMRETLAKATLTKDLEVASALQTTLVPATSDVELEGIQLAGYFKPATHCGGDWWAHHQTPDGKILVLIGHVTGHGIGAALITAAAQGAVSTLLAVNEGKSDLRRVLRSMNAAVHAAANGRFVMTCFATLFDPKSRVVQYANAGHSFPYYYEGATRTLSPLVVRGNRLGDLVGSDYEVKEMTAKPQDAICCYTDGIVAGENIQGEAYGERRFRGEIEEHAHLAPRKAVETIIGRATEFCGDVPQKDDITVVVGRFV
jgi:serine phosphatase RsbU (regulator of sigma subunit)